MCYTSKAIGPKAHNKTQYTLTHRKIENMDRVIDGEDYYHFVAIAESQRPLKKFFFFFGALSSGS